MDDLASDVIEQLPVGGREEDVLPVVTAQCDVVERTGHVKTQRSWHSLALWVSLMCAA
jgi:hypothetical protein